MLILNVSNMYENMFIGIYCLLNTSHIHILTDLEFILSIFILILSYYIFIQIKVNP